MAGSEGCRQGDSSHPPKRFRVLDGWRGVCSVLVVLFHLSAVGHYYQWPLVRHSFMFVDFFFVLSGFVVSHAYAATLTARQGLGTFVVRRLGRLWPLHVAVLIAYIAFEATKWVAVNAQVITLTVAPFTGPNTWSAVPSHLLFLNAHGIHDSATWNGPSWSIGAEFYTYLLFAACCWLARSRLSVVALPTAIAGAVLTACFSREYIETSYDFGFFRCIYGFFCGVLAYRAVSAGRPPNVLDRTGLATVVELALLGGVFVFVGYSGGKPASLAAPLLFGVAVYVFAFEKGEVSRLMLRRVFQRLGAWSYSIYMTHFLLILVVGAFVRVMEKILGVSLHRTGFLGESDYFFDFGNAYVMDLFALAFVLLVIGVSSLSYRFIEEPGRRWFRGAV